MTVSHCSSVVSESVASHSTPALSTAMSRPPSRLTASSTEASHGFRVAHVRAHEHRSRARRDALAARAVAPREDDAGALGAPAA